jgi:hypothetical protein
MEKNNDNYTISYNLYDDENNNFFASGATDLRSNRNRFASRTPDQHQRLLDDPKRSSDNCKFCILGNKNIPSNL